MNDAELGLVDGKGHRMRWRRQIFEGSSLAISISLGYWRRRRTWSARGLSDKESDTALAARTGEFRDGENKEKGRDEKTIKDV